jgi:hypothetical protein
LPIVPPNGFALFALMLPSRCHRDPVDPPGGTMADYAIANPPYASRAEISLLYLRILRQ